MKSSNANLLAQLEELTPGICLYYSDSDYTFKPIIWEVDTKGELTIENLLREVTPPFDEYRPGGKIIKSANLDNYLQMIYQEARKYDPDIAVEIAQIYQTVIKLLQSSLTFLEVAEIRELNDPNSTFRIIFGSTKSGEWIGIAPQLEAEFQEMAPYGEYTHGQPLLSVHPPQTKITAELLAKLEPLLKNLKFYEPQPFVYLSDRISEGFIMRVGATRELMFNSLLDAIGFARTFPYKEFYRDAEDDNDEEFATEIKPLDLLIQSRLSNLRMYLFGLVCTYHVYVLGQTPEGDWAGVSTIGIWS
ncbi:nuclease A inhibitor family protein [Calothrix sp. PCC 7507]|uniref:nuclease A inhibitor family protein n=1 Tax=Calothrix sp. PCC 7507 TaxID=99598 RepID=UPI00029F3530|nr:nuclease A inhibitor family protein [Calothrix sp. PCC 7507]AFY35903.1 hypothetical protein Cal7507_5576 [Calothrix sp. PCC 7507]